ncbi:MAG: hypothetical protein AAGC55_34475, partial [Myxococcota bacterium]
FDGEWQRWSAFRNPAAEVIIDLDIGDLFEDLIELPEATPLPDPGFRDILIPHLGVEWRAFEADRARVDVRAGYVYEPSPAPEQIAESNFIDNGKHTVSLGAGVTVRRYSTILLRPLSLDAFAAVTVLPSRDHAKLSAADPVGDYRSDGVVWQAGLSSRWRF